MMVRWLRCCCDTLFLLFVLWVAHKKMPVLVYLAVVTVTANAPRNSKGLTMRLRGQDYKHTPARNITVTLVHKHANPRIHFGSPGKLKLRTKYMRTVMHIEVRRRCRQPIHVAVPL